MFVTRTLPGKSRMPAIFSPFVLLMALHAPISVTAATADESTTQKVTEGHHHSAQDPDSDPARPTDLENHEDHETAIGVSVTDSDHEDNSSHRRQDGAPAHYEEQHPREYEEDHDVHGHEETSEIHLSPEQRQTLNLEILVLEPRTLGRSLRAPGEVRLNAYATAQLTPRIDAQVLARHARLGEHVVKGQPLVTLSSVAMAEAQGDLVVAEREWQRLAKLKGKFVSDREFLEVTVARQKALTSVLAYGMTQEQAKSLTASEKVDGTFELLAPAGGTVVRDDFILGELVEPGRMLFEITDESVRWVEALMPPEDASEVSVGDLARIAYRNTWFDGRVTQIHHQLDEVTRTQAVRVEVPDPDHRLHPGVFVDVVALSDEGEPVLAIPEAAVLRSPDGDWQLFVAEAEDVFRPVEVELIHTVGGMAVIEGLPAGTKVVTKGAFFLQSELAKAGFDPHNH